jgi:hypothetical protein
MADILCWESVALVLRGRNLNYNCALSRGSSLASSVPVGFAGYYREDHAPCSHFTKLREAGATGVSFDGRYFLSL